MALPGFLRPVGIKYGFLGASPVEAKYALFLEVNGNIFLTEPVRRGILKRYYHVGISLRRLSAVNLPPRSRSLLYVKKKTVHR